MNLISATEVAEFLSVSQARIERMTKENLLNKVEEKDGVAMYDKAAIERYKSFADRLGGI
ncbi:MAG: hypothetical protein ACPG4U_01660 [Pseudomonadales bacterium]